MKLCFWRFLLYYYNSDTRQTSTRRCSRANVDHRRWQGGPSVRRRHCYYYHIVCLVRRSYQNLSQTRVSTAAATRIGNSCVMVIHYMIYSDGDDNNNYNNIYNIINNNMRMYNAPNEIQDTDWRIRRPTIWYRHTYMLHVNQKYIGMYNKAFRKERTAAWSGSSSCRKRLHIRNK